MPTALLAPPSADWIKGLPARRAGLRRAGLDLSVERGFESPHGAEVARRAGTAPGSLRLHVHGEVGLVHGLPTRPRGAGGKREERA